MSISCEIIKSERNAEVKYYDDRYRGRIVDSIELKAEGTEEEAEQKLESALLKCAGCQHHFNGIYPCESAGYTIEKKGWFGSKKHVPVISNLSSDYTIYMRASE